MRQISSLEVKKYCIKGCPLYAIQVLNSVEDNKPILEDHPILREYKYVFQKRYQVYLQEETLISQ
jgi:hypothetical protein